MVSAQLNQFNIHNIYKCTCMHIYIIQEGFLLCILRGIQIEIAKVHLIQLLHITAMEQTNRSCCANGTRFSGNNQDLFASDNFSKEVAPITHRGRVNRNFRRTCGSIL